MKRIAYFVSEHGFGHASRACAVIESLQKISQFEFHIFSNIPDWFFRNSLGQLQLNYRLHPVQVDIGLVQSDPFHEDLSLTLERLSTFYPISPDRLEEIGNRVKALGIELIISDISPFGLLVARYCNIPSLLIENFTWDWIYEPYFAYSQKFEEISKYLQEIFQTATFHIQTDPLCKRDSKFPMVGPIFRESRIERGVTRNSLGLDSNARMVLITMRGIPVNVSQLNMKNLFKDCYFLIITQSVLSQKKSNNLILLPHDHHYFHPDLIRASDVVVGKVGYSTIAEVYSSDVPFLFIGRESFRESVYLEDFILKNLPSQQISLNQFDNGEWQDSLALLLNTSRSKVVHTNGADFISAFISK